MLEVVDHALAVQEIHRCGQEIPVQRFGEAQILLLVRDIGDSNNLLEGYDLDPGDEGNNIDMTGEQGDEETGNHHEGPYRSGNEGLFLLLILGLGGFLNFMLASDICIYIPRPSAAITDLFGYRFVAAANFAGAPGFGDIDIGDTVAALVIFPGIESDISTRFRHGGIKGATSNEIPRGERGEAKLSSCESRRKRCVVFHSFAYKFIY